MAQRHMDRLTSFDTSFLTNEKSNGHMAIGAIMVCEGSAPSYDDFVTHIRSRLHLLPRLRQKLAVSARCTWARRCGSTTRTSTSTTTCSGVTLPAPGTDAQFHEVIGEYLSPPLDRSKSLWELWLTDGFEDDRFGIIYKTHHSMADGISATDVGMLLFDVEPKDEIVRTEEPWHPRRPPRAPSCSASRRRGFVGMFGGAARWLWNAAKAPGKAWKRVSDGVVGLWEVGWNLTKPAPKVAFNTDISARRAASPGRPARSTTSKRSRTRSAAPSTTSPWRSPAAPCAAGSRTATSTPTSSSCRHWSRSRCGPRTTTGELGNRLTAMRGPLPVHIADPYERLRHVTTEMDALKASKQALGAEAIWGLNDWFREFAPPVLLNPTATINFSTRLFNMLVTNFPGPQVPFYVLGRELTAVYPIGFLAKRHALAIAMFSYNGHMHFGLLADRARSRTSTRSPTTSTSRSRSCSR